MNLLTFKHLIVFYIKLLIFTPHNKMEWAKANIDIILIELVL